MDPRPDRIRSLDLVAHLARARHLWLHRMGVAPDGPTDIFPRGTEIAGVRDELRAIQARWDDYLEQLDATELDRTVSYRAMEGDAYENTVEDILTQLHGHSWYHRGQVAQTIRRLGGEPAVTDFVYFARVAR